MYTYLLPPTADLTTPTEVASPALLVEILARIARLYRMTRAGSSDDTFAAPVEVAGEQYTWTLDRDYSTPRPAATLYRLVIDEEGDEVEQEVASVAPEIDCEVMLAREILDAILADVAALGAEEVMP
jgi:hypothetical protein